MPNCNSTISKAFLLHLIIFWNDLQIPESLWSPSSWASHISNISNILGNFMHTQRFSGVLICFFGLCVTFWGQITYIKTFFQQEIWVLVSDEMNWGTVLLILFFHISFSYILLMYILQAYILLFHYVNLISRVFPYRWKLWPLVEKIDKFRNILFLTKYSN